MDISIGQAFSGIQPLMLLITIIGGFIFALCLVTARKQTVGQKPSMQFRRFIIYIYANFVIFYFTFPFAQGLLWYFMSGDYTRLVTVSVTYWAYMAAFAVGTIVIRWWQKRTGRLT